MSTIQKLHFKGLHEIRGIAALCVIVYHIEYYKTLSNIPSLSDGFARVWAVSLGEKGVSMFFVLSGFLITSLLLKEKKDFARINISKFYMRRILRIWPLFYLIIIISFFIIPALANELSWLQEEFLLSYRLEHFKEHRWSSLLLFVVFLPNFVVYLGRRIAGASQSWSIGAEEQFYILWPHLIQRTGKKGILIILLFLIIVYPASPFLLKSIENQAAVPLYYLTYYFPIHMLSAGGLAAYFHFYCNEKYSKWFKNSGMYALSVFVFAYFFFVSYHSWLYVISSAFLILFVVNEKHKFNLRNKILYYLGNISYGLYMFHLLVIYITFSFTHNILEINSSSFWYNPLIYFSVLFASIGISHLSFHYFESIFLRIKTKKYTRYNE